MSNSNQILSTSLILNPSSVGTGAAIQTGQTFDQFLGSGWNTLKDKYFEWLTICYSKSPSKGQLPHLSSNHTIQVPQKSFVLKVLLVARTRLPLLCPLTAKACLLRCICSIRKRRQALHQPLQRRIWSRSLRKKCPWPLSLLLIQPPRCLH